MHSLDLRQVEIFYYVAKFCSFSKAAEALRLTQPTVSGHIKTLEESLALRLFDRLGRGVRLTQAGDVLYNYAKRLLSTKAAAMQALYEFQGGLQGELLIGGSSIPGQYVLPLLLGQFARSYPGVTAVLNITDTTDTIEQIVHGNLELGMVGAQIPHAQVLYHPFIDDELVLAVSSAHPWADRRAIPPAALCTQPFIQRERGSGSRLVVEQTLKQHGFDAATLHVIAEVASTEAIKQGIKAGLGIGIISKLALADELRAGSLCTVAIQEIVLRRSFYIIRHKARALSPLCQTFEHFVLSSDAAALFTHGASPHASQPGQPSPTH